MSTEVGSIAPLNMQIVVGFGCAYVQHDGVKVLDGEQAYRHGREVPTVADAEKLAAETPGHWQLVMDAPLWNARWERCGPGEWVCVESGRGFA